MIELLVGMIGSGKTTYARKRAKEGALVVSHDDLTAMLHAEYRYEEGLRNCYRRMEEELVHIAAWDGRDVVVDRTHLTRESRERWVKFSRRRRDDLFRSPAWDEAFKVVAVVFPLRTPFDHASARFNADPRGRTLGEWIGVAQHHAAQAAAEPIGDDEGFDRIIRIEEAAAHA